MFSCKAFMTRVTLNDTRDFNHDTNYYWQNRIIKFSCKTFTMQLASYNTDSNVPCLIHQDVTLKRTSSYVFLPLSVKSHITPMVDKGLAVLPDDLPRVYSDCVHVIYVHFFRLSCIGSVRQSVCAFPIHAPIRDYYVMFDDALFTVRNLWTWGNAHNRKHWLML